MFRLELAALAKADRSSVLRSFAKFAMQAPSQWLRAGHPAQNGELPRSWASLRSLPASEVAEAVAVAAPQHCMDGWSFVARAIAALLAGDPHAARHLAYYAQLRAGLSLLANLGVGSFNTINFAIDASGAIHRVDPRRDGRRSNKGMGTHTVVWEALKAWASNPKTAVTFLDLVRIRGASLSECLEAIWPGNSSAASASLLIEAWGLDLKRGAQEHSFRNISSYAPHAMNPLPNHVNDSLSFVGEMWRLFEPSTGPSFDSLDRHLLRMLFTKQHSIVDAGPLAEGSISERYDELPAAVAELASKKFLIGEEEPYQPNLLTLARSSNKPATPSEMVARALLLLRAATAFTHTNFVEAGVRCSDGELRPWLNELASARGFWSPSAPLIDPINLWADVELALLELEKSAEGPPSSLHDWLAHTSKGLPVIAEAERIGVWSLCG